MMVKLGSLIFTVSAGGVGHCRTERSISFPHGFVIFAVIPLAKKLADCGVFGVSSDEYLNYARKNRNEWESRGKAIVAEYIENAKDLEVPDDNDESQSSLSEYVDET